MYADAITDSMREAIGETARRRQIQEAFNQEHGIVPRTVKKSITDVSSFISEAERTLEGKTRDRHGTGSHGAFETLAGETSPSEDAEATSDALAEELAGLSESELADVLDALEEEMAVASEAMDFETAARIRDQIVAIRTRAEGSSADAVIARLKSGARKGSAHATRRRYRPHK